jgi:two-component SAPR family response regulator
VRTGLKVLVVDDEKEICFLLSKMLTKKGIECHSVNSLTEAKDFLKTFSPTVIFLDNHLPDGLGIDFIEYLKSNYPMTKVVIITAHDTLTKDGKNPEITNEVIYKPFNSSMIFSTLEQVN